MRTRKGICYYDDRGNGRNGLLREDEGFERKRRGTPVREYADRKRQRLAAAVMPPPPPPPPPQVAAREEIPVQMTDLLNELPDDLLIFILSKLSSKASSPSDVINVRITCKRLNGLILHPLVLSKASSNLVAIKAKGWCDTAHRFLKHCADSGNLEACYILGMIRFYCLGNRGSGASLLAKAAIGSHSTALYSLAVIQFNGSGGSKNNKDLRAGVALCARAAFLGHVDAMRELGHCLQDGYGVRQNFTEGRRFLVQANARELVSVLASTSLQLLKSHDHGHRHRHVSGATTCSLLSDFGCNVPEPESHPANQFLIDWFESKVEDLDTQELRLCSHAGCGRPETRRHEFRRCSVCGIVNYCSRACQALDWKMRHKIECTPIDQWLHGMDVDGGLQAPNGGPAPAAVELFV